MIVAHSKTLSVIQIGLVVIFFIVAFGIRMQASLSNHSLPEEDALEYDQLALNLIQGQGYREEGELTARRPPFYSMFLAGIYAAAGHNYQAVRILQAVLSTLTVVLIAAWAWLLFGAWSGCLAAFLAALHPGFYFYYYGCSALITETLYTFLLTSALFTLYLYFTSRAWMVAALSGFAWGLAILTRPIPLSLLPVLPFALILLGYSFWQTFRYHCIVGVVVLLVLSPWIIRNYLLFKTFVPVATMGGSQFYSSNHPDSDGFGDGLLKGVIYPQEQELKATGMNEAMRSKYFYKKGWEVIFFNPEKSFKLFLRKMFLYMDPIITLYNQTPFKKIINWPYIFILMASCAGFILALKDSAIRQSVLSMVFIFGYFAVIYALWHPGERYRFPSEPILIVLTAYLLGWIPRRLLKNA